MSKKFLIYTDSSSDLPSELAKELDVNVLPLTYYINNKKYVNYLDFRQQPIAEFYNLLREGVKPTTSQVNPEDYLEALKEELDNGRDILILSFSSALSGTYNSGRVAVDELRLMYPDRRISIIDTKAASLGQGFIVRLAALQREKGKTLKETKAYIESILPNVAHWFTVDDISHLRRGGRIGAVSSFVAKTLNIKPIMHMDNEGRLIPRTKVIGRNKSIKALFNKMVETALPNPKTVMIVHGDDINAANKLATLIKDHFKIENVIINHVGPVIGSHTGQGVLALFFLANER